MEAEYCRPKLWYW